MAKQVINVGTAANDKKGDSLRAAFQKVNTNFTELYTALGINADVDLNLGAFEFTGSVMSTTDSTPITIDQATIVTSDLTVGGDIVPNIANGGNLGSAAKPWHSLYVSNNTIYIGGNSLGIDNDGELVWNNNRIAHAGGEFITLETLTDINLGSPQAGDVLLYQGGYWTAGTVDKLKITDGVEFTLVGGPGVANPYVTFPEANGANVLVQGNEISVFGNEVGLSSAEDGVRLAANATATNGPRREWAFGTDGSLTLPGDIRSEGNINIDINLSDSTLRRWQFGEDGNLEAPGIVSAAGLRTSETKIALGSNAGQTSQGSGSVAVGAFTGQTSQGPQSVAIGYGAGAATQGVSSVAVGNLAGSTTQGGLSVAVGSGAGQVNQGYEAVAVGFTTGLQDQGTWSVAIGSYAGAFSQGEDAIAIGRFAGQTDQPDNTIILNASGSAVDGVAAQTNSFYVAPIRTTANGTPLMYNSTTKEITYSNVLEFIGSRISTSDSSGITVDVQTTFNTDVNIENDLIVANGITFSDGSVLKSYRPVTVVAASTTAQTIADAASASFIQFVETVDTAGAYSPGTFTAPYTGYYQVNLSVYFSTTVTLNPGSFFLIDTNLDNTKQVTIFSGAWTGSYLHYSTVIPASAGDAIRIVFRQVSGAAIDISSGSRLTIHRVSVGA